LPNSDFLGPKRLVLTPYPGSHLKIPEIQQACDSSGKHRYFQQIQRATWFYVHGAVLGIEFIIQQLLT
jgi:hypothetical protein